jgi:hypothetical protein
MKQIKSGKFFRLLTAVIFLALHKADAQEVSPAVAYMQSISTEFRSVQESTWGYTRAVAHNKSMRKIENRRKELIAAINTSIGKIKRLKPFEGDAAFRDSSVSSLTVNKFVIQEDYDKIMQLEEIAEQSYDNMEAYLAARQKADEILRETMENTDREEKKFAANHNINLIESQDKLSKKLEQADRVYTYYNKIYLLFFKSYKQEAYLLDATQRGDLNAMEQNKNTLLKFSSDGLTEQKEISSFDGDGSLKIACQQMLNFYNEEADKGYQPIIDFHLKKDIFEKQAASMNDKSKSHSKEEIDAYNKSVNEYNNSIKDINQKMAKLDETRAKLLNNWNSSAANFTGSHVE